MTKLSIRSSEFTRPLAEALDCGKALVIWHQIPWSGGSQEWFLIHRLDALNTIISRGCVASAFTAFEWIDVPTSKIVNQEWLMQVSAALAQELHNMMLLIKPVTSNELEPISLTWVGQVDDLQEYYDKYVGSEAVVGRIPSTSTGKLVRGYYPDANGIAQSGPY